MDPDAVGEALVAVRSLVAADGGDLLITEVTERAVRLRLVLESAECAECVMPRSFLETVVLDMMAPAVTGLMAVEIDDPREP